MLKTKIQFASILYFLSISAIFANSILYINTDKARYEPNSEVKFRIEIEAVEENFKLNINYYSLDNLIETSTWDVNSTIVNWEWLPPNENYRGYMVHIQLLRGTEIIDEETIAVDVSSDWTKFPRYGFLSAFNPINPKTIGQTINNLNRYHINGLQFYDWQYKHHKPLKGTGDEPSISWTDIANKMVYLPTLKNYIDSAHSKNMITMAYNLIYGAYEDAEIDGVSNEWRFFSDRNHIYPDKHDLPDTWASDIYLMNPNNELWQNHLIFETSEAFRAINFDGWHVDQLGDRGTRYDYNGNQINLEDGFRNLLTKAKDSLKCPLVMNAVNQFAQSSIASSSVDFLYTEVWEPYTTYDKLAKIILDNDNLSNNNLKTILAAYIHKGISDTPGQFNTSAVLYANAVIFAFGGVHLELGEHMLSNEYFPSNNLTISADLKEQLIKYYDFLVAYENLLRDESQIISDQLKTDSELNFVPWSRSYNVWNFAREIGNKKVFHLINFTNASTLDWRDNTASQSEPSTNLNIPVYYEASKTAYKVWVASPDYKNGIPIALDFSQTDGRINFTLPSLKYWDMVVIDFDSTTSVTSEGFNLNNFQLSQNFPNPFNPSTMIKYEIPEQCNIKVEIFNMLGQSVGVLVNSDKSAGFYETTWNAENLPSGIYLISIRAEGLSSKKNFVQVKKALLLK